MAISIPELEYELTAATEELKFLQGVLEHWNKAEAHATMAEDLVLKRLQQQQQEAIGAPLKSLTDDHEISSKIKSCQKRVRTEIKVKRKVCREFLRAKKTLRKLSKTSGKGLSN